MVKTWQKNQTITDEQRKFAEANIGKMHIGEISKMLGISYNKLHNNLRLLGLVGSRKHEAVVVDFNEYFDIDSFGKYYNY